MSDNAMIVMWIVIGLFALSAGSWVLVLLGVWVRRRRERRAEEAEARRGTPAQVHVLPRAPTPFTRKRGWYPPKPPPGRPFPRVDWMPETPRRAADDEGEPWMPTGASTRAPESFSGRGGAFGGAGASGAWVSEAASLLKASEFSAPGAEPPREVSEDHVGSDWSAGQASNAPEAPAETEAPADPAPDPEPDTSTDTSEEK